MRVAEVYKIEGFLGILLEVRELQYATAPKRRILEIMVAFLDEGLRGFVDAPVPFTVVVGTHMYDVSTSLDKFCRHIVKFRKVVAVVVGDDPQVVGVAVFKAVHVVSIGAHVYGVRHQFKAGEALLVLFNHLSGVVRRLVVQDDKGAFPEQRIAFKECERCI